MRFRPMIGLFHFIPVQIANAPLKKTKKTYCSVEIFQSLFEQNVNNN